MSLADLQDAIAALICDKRSLAAYAEERPSWLAKRRLPERERKVLDDLDLDSVRAFHEIRARDRAYFIEAVLPLTTRRLGEGWKERYFERRPYGSDDPRIEGAAFVHDLAKGSKDPATCELAAYELGTFLLLDEPPFDPAEGKAVRGPTAASLAPGLAILPASIQLPELVDDPLGEARPAEGAVLLRRDADGVTPAWIDGPIALILLAVSRREHARLRDLLASPEGQDAYREALSQGAFV